MKQVFIELGAYVVGVFTVWVLLTMAYQVVTGSTRVPSGWADMILLAACTVPLAAMCLYDDLKPQTKEKGKTNEYQ